MMPIMITMSIDHVQIEWLENGRISQHWRVTDELALMRQLGVLA